MAPKIPPRNIAGNVVPAFFFSSSIVHKENLIYCAKLLGTLEYETAKDLFRPYCYRYQKYGHRSANIWLRKHVASLRTHESHFPLSLKEINTELKQAKVALDWANQVASIINQLTHGMTQSLAVTTLLHEAMRPARAWGFSPVLPIIDGEATDAQLDMAASALARLQDASWWERQIRKAYRRLREHIAIIVGKVRKGVSPYVSYKAAQDHQERRRAGLAWLRTMYAINPELGVEIPLIEAVKASVSNPEIRRMELMVRMRGCEDLAEEQGWVGEFYTWTAPSKYHACTTRKNKVMDNSKYDGSDPRDTQAYLCQQFSKARAKLGRLGVKFFGFRVVEPHHDGTPHWHMLFFVHPNQCRLLRSVLRHYAIEHDRQELGKAGYKARFDWRAIDPTKGSATGYIAKYISKNIDGFKVGIDEETGTDAKDTVNNVAAWASTWGIRQFQPVGGPSVEVWRQLRRLRERTNNPIIERARQAADTGKWAEFVNAMGGIDAARKDHLIKLAHIIQPATNKYGEDVARLFGLRTAEITVSLNGVTTGVILGLSEIQTKVQGWELSRFGLGERSEMSFSERSDQPLSGGSQRPWSSDNNCTGRSDLSEKDPLDRQMAMLGLDDQDKKRLLGGSIIQIDGLYIRIRNGALLTSRERPGMQPESQDLDNDFDTLRTGEAYWRRRIIGELFSGVVPVDTWLGSVPDRELGAVMMQIDNMLVDESRLNPKTYQEDALLVMLHEFTEDTIDDPEFRSEYLE